MRPGDLVSLKTFTRNVDLMNRGLSGGMAILVSKHTSKQGVLLWDMIITRHPAYGSTSELVVGVSQEDIREMISEAG